MSLIGVLKNLGTRTVYPINQVVFANGVPGVYTLNLRERGYYYVEMVGGGGGGGTGADGDGGTGAVYLGNIFVPGGIYTIQVGGGGIGGGRYDNGQPGSPSSISGIMVCGNGFGGKSVKANPTYMNGLGGTFQILNPIYVLQPENGKNGNDKRSYHQIPAVNPSGFTPNPNCGAGGGADAGNHKGPGGTGGAGYVRITFKGRNLVG